MSPTTCELLCDLILNTDKTMTLPDADLELRNPRRPPTYEQWTTIVKMARLVLGPEE